MNLIKLFEMQKMLMDRIEKEHPTQPGEDRFNKKILALLVEVAECANEWRGFKYWSRNQEPRQLIHTNVCANVDNAEYMSCMDCGEKIYRNDELFKVVIREEICPKCNDSMEFFKKKNPLLEEYVDGLHFVLELGIDCNFDLDYPSAYLTHNIRVFKSETALEQFTETYNIILYFSNDGAEENYDDLLLTYLGLGELLGFTWEQIEQAYMEKIAVNHQRQEEGY
jgi:dimeric dUTPase (all-alpha-NTP-PPase superfamily)